MLAPFLAPWLSQVKPLMLNSTSQFRPGPPPALDSAKYTAEFNEVKRLGEHDSTDRTEAQTKTALFFSDIGVGAFQGALRDFVARRPTMGISRAARLFAAVDMSSPTRPAWSGTVSTTTVFWRPITAIELADTDGNPDTTAQAGWTPLITTPPYPDYTSGLNGVIGAGTRALARVLGTERIDLNITSVAAGRRRATTSGSTPSTATSINARIWGGIHFRTADVVGNAQGQKVAELGTRPLLPTGELTTPAEPGRSAAPAHPIWSGGLAVDVPPVGHRSFRVRRHRDRVRHVRAAGPTSGPCPGRDFAVSAAQQGSVRACPKPGAARFRRRTAGR